MEINIDQKIVMIFFTLGAAVALTSNFFSCPVSPVRSILLAFLFPAAVYLAALLILLKVVTQKKTKPLIYNSFMSFFLIWLVIWILLCNL